MSYIRIGKGATMEKVLLNVWSVLSAMTFFVALHGVAEGRESNIVLAQAPKAAAAATTSAVEALVKAARAEGEVTFYMVMPETTTKRISDAFTAKYGVKNQFIRLPSNPLLQRFSSEAESGTFAPGFLIVAGTAKTFAEEAIKKGWLEPVSQAGIPAITSGEFPAKFVTGPTAIIQITPWAFAYNSAKVKGGEAPKEWSDLLNPKWNTQLLLADVRTADSYLDVWAMLLDRYGESYFKQLQALGPRTGYSSGTALVQGLAAGEGMVAGPSTMALVLGQKNRGAPIEGIIPAFTTGLEQHIMLTPHARVKQPNAARLFVHYLLSRDGNRVLNDEPGSVGAYDETGLPKNYQSPKPGTAARKEQIFKLLGVR